MFTAFRTLRARVLAIALVPSIALLVVGGGGAVYLVVQGQKLRSWGDEQSAHASPGLVYSQTVQQERRLTLLRLAGHPELATGLPDVRPKVDASLQQMIVAATAFEKLNPGSTASAGEGYRALAHDLAAVRVKVDSNAMSIIDAYNFYNRLTEVVSTAMVSFAHSAPDTEIALGLSTIAGMFAAAEAMARAHDLAVAAAAVGPLSPVEAEEFAREVGFYHNQMQTLLPSLTADSRAQWQALTESPEWRKLGGVESILIRRGAAAPADDTDAPSPRGSGRLDPVRNDDIALPMSTTEWESAVVAVSGKLLEVWVGQAGSVTASTRELGDRRAWNSLAGGLVVLLVTVAAFGTTLHLSSRMIRRLHRLRSETITLTDEQLPAIVGSLSRGEPVDIEQEMTRLDFGTDEIGQVADAFNRAQLAAVNAAATEARTRDGVNSVFLNIAHRSQVVLHRHLKLLNEAEYEQEDPKILDLLFRLHHLATRERRNAENLIILGGEQPRRQWRQPVQLDELVRGAIAETQDYSRVRVGRLPDVKVSGAVIADLIHLLAELVDNATAFSPPDSRVEVVGNVVGRGIVVEVVDQGLGMPEEQIAELNRTLSSPPDFALAALSSDNRLGMFVVARLAARIEVSVRLTESEYGGIKAVVLIPATLLTQEIDGPQSWTASPEPQTAVFAAGSGAAPAAPGRVWHSVEREDPSRELVDRRGYGGHGALAAEPAEPRPDLPRRRRQAHLAPQLATRPSSTDATVERPAERSADQARDLFSAIESGTRQGRVARPRPLSYPDNNSE
ncbi:nitrate- and nitrite sensing domain-containing protein [Nocardia sp. alder85J]|uniref:sensor histidine kinase n=1 Tax=Nocardia sp. alder85J TaxID=2862949 RepID=UPI001CD69026|nr:nitrate- and nitrite sensing domain-containing protein [Nocardia sp. alder85J]MCX4095759.1 nitrate- and nitrite sensing domain-containing protein [Nocardia sp. alder85J]